MTIKVGKWYYEIILEKVNYDGSKVEVEQMLKPFAEDFYNDDIDLYIMSMTDFRILIEDIKNAVSDYNDGMGSDYFDNDAEKYVLYINNKVFEGY